MKTFFNNRFKIPNDLDKVQLESTRRDVDMSYAFNGQYRPILCKYISHVSKSLL